MNNIKHRINCPKCNSGKMKPGQSLVPIWGRLDGKKARYGDTLNMVGSKLAVVDKCNSCGFSLA